MKGTPAAFPLLPFGCWQAVAKGRMVHISPEPKRERLTLLFFFLIECVLACHFIMNLAPIC